MKKSLYFGEVNIHSGGSCIFYINILITMNKTAKIIVGIGVGIVVLIAMLFAFNIISYTAFTSQTSSLVEVQTGNTENTAIKNSESVPSCDENTDEFSQCAVPLEEFTSS